MASDVDATGLEIAVVGLAGRFPGAPDIDTFWRNIRDGVESVVRYSDDELRQRGVSETLLADATYVKAGVPFEGMDLFDAGFFGYTPRDAEQLDPQHRLFLECAWQALEHAGYDPARHAGSIGVYAGAGASVYLMKHLLSHHALNADTGVADLLALLSGNMADALATRVAYKLNLRGPAVTVQTACSTSLMAVHTACQSLLSHECDMALAGGVSLNLLQNGGYRYQTGAIFSPDGHCRAFDAKAAGTLQGSGVGVVVLKRLEDALQDGDCIQAVIKASAANNDGSDKVGFTAPSIGGQAAVIRTAQVLAGVAADSIGYIEAHGTGTTLGDPIEIAALSQAFRAESQRNEFCAIGSVKTNVGHLDAAAGVTGFIKTVLALKHRTLPPSLHFEQPNPQIDFKRSPFYVNTEARPWQANGSRRRAGVSSFGIGGTNVHVVLEEAPESAVPKAIAADSIRGCEFLQLSARSAPALAHSIDQLELHLAQHPELDLAEVAHTLRVGRKRFDQRAVVLAGDRNDAVHALKTRNATTLISGKILSERPTVAFLFPGQGAQHPNMGRELYEKETAFREVLDRCCDYLKAGLGLDLRDLLFPAAANDAESAARLAQTELTQPALFAMEYALAHYWIAKGLKPDAMLGHSIGEYVAACLADVFTLEDALDLVVARGQLIQSTAPGAMLAVNLPTTELHALASGCDLAAVNADGLGVLSGNPAAIDAIERALIARDVPVRRLHVSHAFHSALLDPVLNDFRTLVSRVERRAPSIPFVSNLTGQWITAEEACSADYWVEHLRSTVRFADGLSTLLAKPDRILLEVGPGDTLSSLARRHPLAATQRPILTSQCHPREQASNSNQLERCLAGLWVAGIELDAMIAPAARVLRRVPLPTYPFERKSYWIAPAKPEQVDAKNAKAEIAQPEAVAHFYVPTWQRSNKHLANSERKEGVLLLLGNHDSFTHCLQQNLSNVGFTVASATQSAEFAMLSVDRYELRPACREDFERLIVAVEAQLGTVTAICHLWSLDTPADLALENGFYSLQALAQALGANRTATAKQKLSITVLANQVEDVTGIEPLCPEKATLIGLSKVIPQELPGVSCTLIDVIAPAAGPNEDRLAQQIATEISADSKDEIVAYRGSQRWVKHFEPVRLTDQTASRLRQRGVYLITGGLGGIGLALARHLAQHRQARLVLIGRSALSEPQRHQLLQLEQLGAEVLTLQADVSDAKQLFAAVEKARSHFGTIDGAIHAAGVAGGGMIANRSRDAVTEVMAPKVAGARNLVEALRAEPVSFILLCSSLSALVGGFGQSDYCAANNFLDVFAASENQRGQAPVISVNWDTWRDVGMAAGQTLPEGWGFTPAQGGVVLEAILNNPTLAQVAVSSVALERHFAEANSNELADRLLAEPATGRLRHPRPALPTPYAEPTSDFEFDLASLWSDYLGIESIGIHDHFLELGGDSLLAIQLLARMRRDYDVNIHPAELFKNPTVAALALLIETRLIEEIEAADCPSKTNSIAVIG